ncbi:hypothetical protein C0389_05925 [bacterium]|nr:hypothetical protein [bacterium]
MNKDHLNYHCIFFLFLLSSACNTNKKSDVDLWLIKKEIKWGMNYNAIEKILDDKYHLIYKNKVQVYNKSSYLFSGGSIDGIKTKGWKFNFINDAIEGIDILIENETKEEMLWNYQRLSRHFSKIAERDYGASNDSWRYCQIGNDGEKSCDTDIFMFKKEKKILVNIFRANNYNESIFIFN